MSGRQGTQVPQFHRNSKEPRRALRPNPPPRVWREGTRSPARWL